MQRPGLSPSSSLRSKFARLVGRGSLFAATALTLAACGKGEENPQLGASTGAQSSAPEPGQTGEPTKAPGPDGTGSGPSTPTDPIEEECASDLHQLRHEVWSPILKPKCLLCHNSAGIARNSSLVLVDSDWGPTYMEKNLQAMTEVALNERNGVSLLLLKPTNQVSHGGGTLIDDGDTEYKAIQEFVRRLKNPQDCSEDDKKLAEAYARIALMDEGQTLRKAALNLVGRVPTDQELATVQGQGADSLDAVLDAMMHEDAYYDRLLNFFNDFLLTDQYKKSAFALNLLDRNDYPNLYWYNEEDESLRGKLRDYSNDGVARDALNLIVHVVRNDRNFSEILTADYMMVNPFSAKSYGLDVTFDDPEDPNEFQEAKIPGIPHAGVLTSPMFLNRFPTSETNRNRHRSRMIFEFFLATDVQALAARPTDPSKVVDHNPTLNNPSCSNCHANIDPVAGAMKNWDLQGRYRPPLEGWFPGMLTPGLGQATLPPDQSATAARWLAQEIVSDKRFSISMTHMVYQMLTGQTPLHEPSEASDPGYAGQLRAYELQTQYFSKIAKAFRDNNGELRTIFKEIIKSPYYRALDSNQLSGEEQAVFAEIGSPRLLTPEQLDLKITALMGYPWKLRVNNVNNLLSEGRFRIFYGGIDSESVVERITEPSGLMANVAARMAQEVACFNTARDFGTDKAERRLFPHVDADQLPKDENGAEDPSAVAAIRKNIQHLHAHLLGETLSLDDPQIQRTYELYLGVLAAGQKALAEGEQSVNMHSSCRYLRDFWEDTVLPAEAQISRDPDYSIRAWMAVMTYLLSDYRFLHE